ncbi:Pkinase-domain-containing protein [Violaceomyces palustris]|uniref:Pkinase-domain-containing protein n=1 Tax=Violaceomyces palustris TaxID=1673888 RepID=A0ACD0NUZ7_9BASI|nr:Pkinase-domain-containing protein [Violaceomyces palustris]
MSYPSISASPHPSSPPLSPEHHGYVSSTQARSGSRESTPTSIHPAGQASSRSPTVASSAAAAAGSRSPGYPSPPASPPQRGDPKSGTMGPPQTVPRSSHAHRTSTSPSSPSSSGGSGAYSSMTGASVTLQQPATQTYAHLPPGRAATGGQSHSHRPVSAMPTPVDHSSSRSSQASGNVFASMQGTYAERRASAHPTMSSSSSSSSTPGGGSSAPPLPSSPHGMDAITNQAISSGIPITSPAALSYFAAHPRRQQVHFGNYLLLQTLGEGEFGKVKLGVHKEWGEEVAVKLIKREKVGTPGGQLQLNNPEKDPAKMSKVEREIQVLKDVRHPNIVRLYEVIESDRYIGIVLERRIV